MVLAEISLLVNKNELYASCILEDLRYSTLGMRVQLAFVGLFILHLNKKNA